MDEWIRFLGVMSALSVSAQTVTEQLKKRISFLKLQRSGDDPILNMAEHIVQKKEMIRHSNVQFISGVNGTLLAWMGQIHPLQLLGITPLWSTLQPQELADVLDYVTAGVLVSYGGPWFNEMLDAIRFYKQTLKTQMQPKQ
ncbi:hypothetical protein LSG31_14445 [Fodinisporobacter ferrooxydans]|uniref:Uncharacterized protein n=1 Tax=Fodinisporobacter ferrooxydans TaxID=2901836 RepID=A0ABY4CMP0_9BACL|nr:hypothetical protein LSG31_14445 [Alicyclobacillaceae bacterium MYW30-H2]